MMTKKLRQLTVFSLVMITIGSVDSIRNLPATALFGSSLIFFFLFGAVFFLIPSALISAELSSAWPEAGGVYIWVKRAFGDRIGFLAIWFQWIENVIWYPTILAFVAGTLAYLFSPALAHNKIYLISVIFAAIWGTTIINLFGMESSAKFSSFCALVGLILPMLLIITLGAIWFFSGNIVQIQFSPHDLLPNLHQPQAWVALTGIMLSYCGMEIATVHAREVKDPQRAFPKALMISAVILIVTLLLGSLSIAIVLPTKQISLVAGIMQAFQAFFHAEHMSWMMPIVVIMLVIGALGGVSNWLIAPAKGLLIVADDGHLHPHFARRNRYQAPHVLLIYQAIIVSLLITIFLLLPSINASYWLLTALSSQLYMLMYFLMFAAGIYLRFKHPEKKRPYKIPGGVFGMILLAGFGIIGTIVTVIVGFIPPADMHIGSLFRYESILIIGIIVMSTPPLILYQIRKRKRERDLK